MRSTSWRQQTWQDTTKVHAETLRHQRERAWNWRWDASRRDHRWVQTSTRSWHVDWWNASLSQFNTWISPESIGLNCNQRRWKEKRFPARRHDEDHLSDKHSWVESKLEKRSEQVLASRDQVLLGPEDSQFLGKSRQSKENHKDEELAGWPRVIGLGWHHVWHACFLKTGL